MIKAGSDLLHVRSLVVQPAPLAAFFRSFPVVERVSDADERGLP